jgi:hypothetical protein
MLLDGRYRLRPQASSASIVASAPGHAFTASGAGLEGEAEVACGALVRVAVRFPLFALEASDPIGTRQLSRFFGPTSRPWAEASLLAPAQLDVAPGGVLQGRLSMGFTFPEGPRPPRAFEVELSGHLPRLSARVVGASFTAFGFSPPRLLLWRVADPLRLELELDVERLS